MSNSYHSSFARIRLAAIPSDGQMPLAFALTGIWSALPGLIDITLTGMTYTQINDTEQDSPGGYKQYYAGRGEPITAALKISYSAAKLAILTRFLPEPFGTGTGFRAPATGYGNKMFEFELSPDLYVRTFGYLNLGAFGAGEDDRRTIEATVQGSGPPVLVAPTGVFPVFPLTVPLTFGTAGSQTPGTVPA